MQKLGWWFCSWKTLWRHIRQYRHLLEEIERSRGGPDEDLIQRVLTQQLDRLEGSIGHSLLLVLLVIPLEKDPMIGATKSAPR